MNDSVGWREEGKKKRGSRTGPATMRWGNWSGSEIPTLGQTFGMEGKHLSHWRVQQLICDSLNGVIIHNKPCHSPIYPREGHKSPGTLRGWELDHRGWRAHPEQGQLLTVRSQPEGMEGRDLSRECLWRKAGQPRRQGNTAESHTGGGAITVASLTPHTSASSWPIEKNPREGGPLSAWCAEQ